MSYNYFAEDTEHYLSVQCKNLCNFNNLNWSPKTNHDTDVSKFSKTEWGQKDVLILGSSCTQKTLQHTLGPLLENIQTQSKNVVIFFDIIKTFLH